MMVSSCTETTSATQAGHPPRFQKWPDKADPALPPA
jgi:hypothetical protein